MSREILLQQRSTQFPKLRARVLQEPRSWTQTLYSLQTALNLANRRFQVDFTHVIVAVRKVPVQQGRYAEVVMEKTGHVGALTCIPGTPR